MNDDSFYNSREHFIPKSNRGVVNREQSGSASTRHNRVRRTKNIGLRRLYHLLRKKSGSKLLIGMFLIIILLFILFTMFQNF